MCVCVWGWVGGLGGGVYIVSGKAFFMVSSLDLKYKLMRLSTHYFFGLLQDLFNVFFYEIQLSFFSFSVVHFFQGTSVSITFYVFEHYQLWMMDVFCKDTKLVCVAH